MTYNSLYELRPRLESIYNKVERLDKLGFETKEFLDEIKMLDSKIDNIKEENNSMIGSSSYQAQDNKLINDLNALIDSFESFIDKLLLSMQIFEKNKTIELELESINDEEELNKLIPVILNNLLDLNELKKYGFNFNDENKSIFKTLYAAINKEYQFNGESRIHNALINMNLNTELHPYIINDDTFHTKEEAERILESSENEKELLFMISLNNNKSLKEKIYNKKTYLDRQIDNEKIIVNINEDKIKDKDRDINNLKEKLKKIRKKYLKNAISCILSFGILSGSMYGVYSLGRPKTKTYYKTTKACYDVLDGTYFSTTYSENLDNPRIIKVYTPLNDNGKRNLRIYALDGQSDNPSDYIDIELSDESLISEYKNITDNKNTPEEFRVVEITTNVDTEESFDKKGSSALTVLYAFLVMTLWAVMDILVSNRFEIGAVNMFFGDSFESIQDLFKAKKRIKEELLERKKLEDDFSNFKSEFEKLVKMDDELTIKYEILFNEEKQKKLKLK